MRVEGAQLPHRPHPGHRHQRLLPRGDIGHRHSRRQRLPRPGRKLNWKHFGSSFGLENGLKLLSDSVTLPGGAATCSEGFVYFFLRVPQGCLAVLQLPCYPSKQGELLENMLQNLRNKWPPHPVHCTHIVLILILSYCITMGEGGLQAVQTRYRAYRL